MFYTRHLETKTQSVMGNTAYQFLKFISYKALFLEYKPSHQAAAACILLVNIYTSMAAVEVGLVTSEHQIRTLSESLKKDRPFESGKPLASWDTNLEELTLIKAKDLRDVYAILLYMINENQFKGRLAHFPELWLAE